MRPPGTAVFVPRPEDRRGAVALEDETIVLAVGGWPGRAYHSLPWEPIYLAQGAMRRGDWAEAAEILEREAGETHPPADHPVQDRVLPCAGGRPRRGSEGPEPGDRPRADDP